MAPSSYSCSLSISIRWLILVAIIWLQSINGTSYNFPAYSSQLKQHLSISQVQLNNLVVASDAGKLFAWLAGVATRHLPLWFVLLLGALLGLTGYGFQYLLLANKISHLSHTQIVVLCILAGNSICWINTVCYIVNIRNFPPTHRALTTSYMMLSAKIYTVIADLFFSGETSAFLLLNSVVPLVISLVTAPLVWKSGSDEPGKMELGFVVLCVIAFVTGIYAVIGVFEFATSDLRHAIGLVALLVAPLIVPVVAAARGGKWRFMRERASVFTSNVGVGEEEVNQQSELAEAGRGKQDRKLEIGWTSMVKSVNFWLYFFVYMFGPTLGLLFSSNLGQIVESRGRAKISSLVSLSSSFAFFGRLLPPAVDYLLSKVNYKVSRTTHIAIFMIPMVGAFFLLLNISNLCLYISTAILGGCTGAITALAVAATSELFGPKNFGVNHNILVANIPLGSLLFGYFASLAYDIEGGLGSSTCIGTNCYRKTFIIWGTFCALGTFLSFILYYRTRNPSVRHVLVV